MLLVDIKFVDVKKYLKRSKTVIIPIGSTEQHSRALPLGMDSFLAEKISKSIATRQKWLVTPTITVGFSSGHQPFMRFAGTISCRPGTVKSVLVDYIESLQQHGFKNFFIVNAHGGNNKIIKNVVNIFYKTSAGKFYLHNWWKMQGVAEYALNKLDDGQLGHAGASEASLALYLFPNLVNKKQFSKEYVGVNTKTGIINSDQTRASNTHGRNLYDLIIKKTLKEITENKIFFNK